MATIHIFEATGEQINVLHPYTDPQTGRHGINLNTPEEKERYGIVEVQLPEPPANWHEGIGYRNTQSNPPFLTYGWKFPQQVFDELWQKIKAHRDGLQVAGCNVGLKWFHNDVKSRTQWECMARKSQKQLDAGAVEADPYTINGVQVPWQTMDGSSEPLTLGRVIEVVDGLELQEAMIFNTAKYHKAQLAAISVMENKTPEEIVVLLDTYNWKVGWPEVFQQ